MREILFRGKTKNELPSRWIFGSLTDVVHKWFIDDYKTNARVITETIGQYTGIKDINGEKIFEGDIVRCKKMDSEYIVIVEWADLLAGYHLKYLDKATYLCELAFAYDIEVIGNRWDTPELLKNE